MQESTTHWSEEPIPCRSSLGCVFHKAVSYVFGLEEGKPGEMRDSVALYHRTILYVII